MKPGTMALARVQQADGLFKTRPGVVLKEMPPYRDLLVCAVSSQLRHEYPGFDEIIQKHDDDFADSGLKVASLVRLGLLATLPRDVILGKGEKDLRRGVLLDRLSPMERSPSRSSRRAAS